MHMQNELLSIPVAAGSCAVAAGALGFICSKAGKVIDSDKFALMGILGAFVFAAQMINFLLPLMPVLGLYSRALHGKPKRRSVHVSNSRCVLLQLAENCSWLNGEDQKALRVSTSIAERSLRCPITIIDGFNTRLL